MTTKSSCGLAKILANKIFQCGDVPYSKCQRIEFKGNMRNGSEIIQGGLCFLSLELLIKSEIDEYNNQPTRGRE